MIRAAATFVAAAALASGCSDDSKDEAAPTTAPPAATTAPSPAATTAASPTTAARPTTTRATRTAPINAWARKADAICLRYQKQIDAVPAPANEAQLAPTLRKTLVPIRRQEKALKQLGPPQQNVAIGLAFIGSIVSTRRSIEQVVAGLDADDAARTQDSYAKAAAAGARTRGYAAQLGLVHCGSKRGPTR